MKVNSGVVGKHHKVELRKFPLFSDIGLMIDGQLVASIKEAPDGRMQIAIARHDTERDWKNALLFTVRNKP